MLERACFVKISAKLHRTVVPMKRSIRGMARDMRGSIIVPPLLILTTSTWLERYKNDVIRRRRMEFDATTEPQNRSHWLTLHHRGWGLHFRRLHATWQSADCCVTSTWCTLPFSACQVIQFLQIFWENRLKGRLRRTFTFWIFPIYKQREKVIYLYILYICFIVESITSGKTTEINSWRERERERNILPRAKITNVLTKQWNNKIASAFRTCLRSKYNHKTKSCIIDHLEASRYADFIAVLNYILFAFDNICFQLDSLQNIFIL